MSYHYYNSLLSDVQGRKEFVSLGVTNSVLFCFFKLCLLKFRWFYERLGRFKGVENDLIGKIDWD